MVDARGRSIPVEYVEKFDRDRVARRILARYKKAEAYLARVKAETLADIAALRQDGKTGNFQFMSFDARIRVRLDARTAVEFDHRFNEAQNLIFEYLDEITKETGRPDIASIVQVAFKPSSGGLLSRARVLSLTRLDIKHGKWLHAMDLLKKSQFPKMGKTYVYCETRPVPGGDFDAILLDLASVDPAADGRVPTPETPSESPS